MIPEEVIQEIRDRTDIVEVIGSVVNLQRKGQNYVALCPFHQDKKPSFTVSPRKQIYHCFGCHRGGNVINFLMEYEGTGFVDVVRRLGRDAGVEVEQYLKKDKVRSSRFQRFYRAMEFAAGFYQKALNSRKDAGKAKQYLKKRGISSGTVDEFSIGFAPSGWDNLEKAATREGIGLETLLKLDLVRKNRRGGGQHDYFRNRLIFPIKSLSRRYVGLAGRVLDDSEPKYLNSSESPIYSKGKILYGLADSRENIRKSGNVILVEGYMDYLMLWDKNIRNAAAVCGTALTKEQAGILARLAKRVYIINDGDEAGTRAAVRAADQLIGEELEVQIVKLPRREDPDSFVKKHGADALKSRMRSAPNYFSYLREEAERGKNKTYRRNQVIKHLLNSVERVRDPIRRELYYQEISELFKVPVDALRNGASFRGGVERGRGRRKTVSGKSNKREEFQKIIFRIALENKNFAEILLNGIEMEVLEGELYRKLFSMIDQAVDSNIDIGDSAFLGSIDEPELARFVSELALMDLPPGPVESFLVDTMIWLKSAWLRDRKDHLKMKLTELEEDGKSESEEAVRIVEDYRDVTKKLKSFCPGEGRESNES